jgi:hypothetical protein
LTKAKDGTYGFAYNDFPFCPRCGSLMPYSLKKLKSFFEVYHIHPALSDALKLVYKSEFEAAARESFVTLENVLKKKSKLDLHGFELATKALAFEKDKQSLNPVNKAKDLFDRVTGKEKEPEPPTKMDIYLDRILTEQEENKKLKKQDKPKCGLFSLLKRNGKATSSENGTEKTKDYQHN